MFVLHNADGVSQVSKVSGNRQLGTGTSKFDLTLLLSETEHGLDGLIEYSTDLFDAETIRRLCGHYGTLLDGIVRDPDQRVAALPLLTDGERRQLLVARNDTVATFPPRDRGVHQLIQEVAERAPDQIAIAFERQPVTYGELDRRANQLAHHLDGLDVGPGAPVGLLVERSTRSEERRVGKECRSRWSPYH